MLGAWMAGRAFPGLRTCWRHFKMTDLQCALNFLHYWLCQRRFHRQMPSCEFISSCWLPREHTQLVMHKILFCCFCPVTASSSPQQWLLWDPPARHWQPAKKAMLWSRSHYTFDIIAAYPHKQEQKVELLHLAGSLHYTIYKHTHDILSYITPSSAISSVLITTHCFDNDSSSLHNLTWCPQRIWGGVLKSDGSETTETHLGRLNVSCPFN